MLQRRIKRLADRDARAVERLVRIETSITALSDDDLLDLADIFQGAQQGPLGESALAEMAKRSLSL